MSSTPLQVGEVVEVTTERIAYGGDAVARHQGFVVFVPLAAPGERLRARITERRKSFARARIEEILAPSPSRRAPACPYFGDCGGCQLQHIVYSSQLEAKAGFVRDALTRIARIDWPNEIEVRSAKEYGYRARAQIKLEWSTEAAARTGHTLRVGFYRPGSRSVCDVESCPILLPELNAALARLRTALDARRTPDLEHLREIEMAAAGANVAFEPHISGEPSGVLQQSVAGASYRFTPSTFFQANPFLIEQLVSQALGHRSGELAMDLYAGVGLFTVQLARRFNRVIGVESEARAAEFARQNLAENGARNVEFHTSRAGPWLHDYLKRSGRDDSAAPDLLLLNPPRGGAAEAVTVIPLIRPARITYVSCNPSTLARDLRVLADSGYKLAGVTAFDLFPQTYHVETVVRLTL